MFREGGRGWFEKEGSFQVDGLAEIKERLMQLPEAVGKRALKRAMFDNSVIIRDDAIRRAPERTGRLKEFIGRSAGRAKGTDGNYEAVVLVGLVHLTKARLKKKGLSVDAYYGKFVEFGTRYMSAEPFLRPAFDSKKEEFVLSMRHSLWELILKAVIKLGGKA